MTCEAQLYGSQTSVLSFTFYFFKAAVLGEHPTLLQLHTYLMFVGNVNFTSELREKAYGMLHGVNLPAFLERVV